MMHQLYHFETVLNDRPVREEIIQHDEIISLKIDMEVLTLDEFYKKYFSLKI